MATSNDRKKNSNSSAKRSAGRKAGTSGPGAITLLKADHREVERWFEQFGKSRSDGKKLELAQKNCSALKVHTAIEEEIFYPAFLQATGDTNLHHEAEIEHDGAQKLVAQIESSTPDDDYYSSKVKVLSEMIKHHVKEEEKREGMFAAAKKSEMDMKMLGVQLEARKNELMGETASSSPRPSPSARSRVGA